jgi:NAD(P)-dependent dehydrogenase (short-subunit alcohol dehydrogenase family)
MTTDEKKTGKLEGRIALVTGGTSGIGLATAKRFVAEGAYVFITGRREKELASAVKSIGGSVTGVQGDVSQIGDSNDSSLRLTKRRVVSIFCSRMLGPQNMRPSGRSPRSSLTQYSTSM